MSTLWHRTEEYPPAPKMVLTFLATLACLSLTPSLGDEMWHVSVPPAAIWSAVPSSPDWRHVDSIEIPIEIERREQRPGENLECFFFFQNKHDLWFQTAEPLILREATHLLRVNLNEENAQLVCLNGRCPFSTDTLRWVRSWGLMVFSTQKTHACLRIGLPRFLPARNRALAIVDARLPELAVAGHVCLVRFYLTGFSGNPFRTSEVCAKLVVRSDEEETSCPAFYYQAYTRVRHPGSGQWRLVPLGAPEWRAYWRPEREGVHRVGIVVQMREVRLEENLGVCHVHPASSGMSPRDPSPPSPFPTDTSEAHSRLIAQYEGALWEWRDGEWQPAASSAFPHRYWAPRLDWTPTWGRFTGLGEFDMQEAWQLEERVSVPQNKVGPLPILAFDEDELDDQGTYNWVDHPINQRNGGWLDRPHQFYEDEQATELILDRCRYLVARYGHQPGVQGLLFLSTRLEPQPVEWLRSLAQALQEEFPTLRIFCNNGELPARTRLRPLELERHWQADARLSRNTTVAPQPLTGETLVMAEDEETVAVTARVCQHWAGEAAFQCDVFTPEVPGQHVQALCFLRTDPLRVFQCRLLPVEGGRWNRLHFPFDRPEWWTCLQKPEATLSPYELLTVREVGLRFFASRRGPITVTLRNSRLVGPYQFEEKAYPPLAICDLAGAGENVPQYEKFELRFQLNRVFHNPYDPYEIDVSLEWVTPNGQRMRHPGFFLEPWELIWRGEEEVAVHTGKPLWCVRISPQETGVHTWRLVAKTVTEKAEVNGRFTCVPGTSRGFVRISPRDPRYFEFSDGSFYFPIGHNLRSPGDNRAARQGSQAMKNATWALRSGTRAYERWFARMHAHGENFSRVWMCPWWCGLEWNASAKGYHGLGYYNQANAARLDRIVELATRYGIFLNLETQNHGALSTRVDADWAANPLNVCTQPGGFLRHATEFFDSRQAQELHRRRLRYTLARWGYSRAIAWWGVLTEAEWVEAYFRSVRGTQVERELPNADWIPRPYPSHVHRHKVIDWIAQTCAFVRTMDAHPHPVSAHFSMPFHGQELWSRPDVDIVHNNTYTQCVQWWRLPAFRPDDGLADVIFVFAQEYDRLARHKPLMVGEWGGNPHGSPADHLTAELHTGLWTMAMTRCAGVAGFWWWNFVDGYDLYPHFRALAAFLHGDDRRGRPWVSRRARLFFPEAQGTNDFRIRQGLTFGGEDALQAYVFCKEANRLHKAQPARGFDDPAFPLSGQGWMEAPEELADGVYNIEYWNTFEGSVLGTEFVEIRSGQRRLPIPSHRVDLALKVKRQTQPPPCDGQP